MEIEKNLVVSTCNITEEDSKLLADAAANLAKYNLIVYNDNEYWILVYLKNSYPKLEEFSEAFRKLWKFARKHEEGFTYLKLDRDGEPLEGFETFDW